MLGCSVRPEWRNERIRIRKRLPSEHFVEKNQRGSIRGRAGMEIYKRRYTLDLLEPSLSGAGAIGFEAASQIYFGKPSNAVTVSEAAMLAGLLTAPSYYAPTNNLERARQRANLVISLMRRQRYLTANEAELAKNTPAGLSNAAANRAGGHFADWVMNSVPDFLTRDSTKISSFERHSISPFKQLPKKRYCKCSGEKVRRGRKRKSLSL